MADDEDREERDEDEEDEEETAEEKPAPKKAAPKPVKASGDSSSSLSGGDVHSELKKIRILIEEGRDQQKQYLWILFPIVAILLIQTILYATRL